MNLNPCQRHTPSIHYYLLPLHCGQRSLVGAIIDRPFVTALPAQKSIVVGNGFICSLQLYFSASKTITKGRAMLAPTIICFGADLTSTHGTGKPVFSVVHKHRGQYGCCGIPTVNYRQNHNRRNG